MGVKRATFAQWHNDTQRELPRGTSACTRGPWTSPRDTPERVPHKHDMMLDIFYAHHCFLPNSMCAMPC